MTGVARVPLSRGGPGNPTWGSTTADVALLGTYVPQLWLQVLQLSLSGTPGEALEALKPYEIRVFTVFCESPQVMSRAPQELSRSNQK